MIHVIESMGEITATLASLRFALLLLAPLAVALSAASGCWLAGRALAPVDQVTSLAREIEASQLSRRLPAPRARDEIGRLVETFNQMIARLEASFEAMKRDGGTLMPQAEQLFIGGAQTFFYQGTNSRWREVLTDAEADLYEQKIKAELSRALIRWLTEGRLVAGDPRSSGD